jgi:hypothetical protein
VHELEDIAVLEANSRKGGTVTKDLTVPFHHDQTGVEVEVIKEGLDGPTRWDITSFAIDPKRQPRLGGGGGGHLLKILHRGPRRVWRSPDAADGRHAVGTGIS